MLGGARGWEGADRIGRVCVTLARRDRQIITLVNLARRARAARPHYARRALDEIARSGGRERVAQALGRQI